MLGAIQHARLGLEPAHHIAACRPLQTEANKREGEKEEKRRARLQACASASSPSPSLLISGLSTGTSHDYLRAVL